MQRLRLLTGHAEIRQKIDDFAYPDMEFWQETKPISHARTWASHTVKCQLPEHAFIINCGSAHFAGQVDFRSEKSG